MIYKKKILLEGSTISDYDPEWKCSKCDNEATISYLSTKYCEEHWEVELGYRKEK